MPGIVAGALCAHPPILLTEVGRLESQRVRTTAQAMRELDVLLASGDLSHRLTPNAPYGFRPEGPVFDRIVIGALRDHEWGRIEGMDRDLIEEAGECGLRPLAILLGAARAAGLASQVLSYEGPFGVGYPVVAFRARTLA